MPFGDFVLDINATTPAVLISGCVGLTPMMSMLNSITSQQGQPRRVVFVHAARNGHVHALKHTLMRAVADNPSVSRVVFYEDVGENDQKGVDYDHVMLAGWIWQRLRIRLFFLMRITIFVVVGLL